MGAVKHDSKESKSHGVVIALFLALFVIGGGTAYLLLAKKSNPEGERKETKVEAPIPKQEQVVETKSLVEVPPPLPEETPTLPVVEPVEEETSQGSKSGKKKYGPPTGTIDPKVARAYIKNNTGKVRQCYEKELKINNLLMGTVNTSILVNTDGSVANIKILSDTVRSSALKQCMKKEIISWNFPKPEGGRAEVQFPFRFEPKN
ncbi:MAG: AgmX/PglI C-terminal domain-containing protein [Pseudomonadota bacterium]